MYIIAFGLRLRNDDFVVWVVLQTRLRQQIRIVVCRNTVPPPELAADTPVFDVLQPVAVGVLVFGGIEDDVVVHDGRQGDVCEVLHLHEPLQAQPRLDRHVRALGIADLVVVVLDFLHEVKGLEVFHNLLAAIETVHAVVLAYVRLQLFLYRVHVQMSVRREDIDGLEVVFLSQRVVVHVVRRCHFEAAGTETDLYVAVFDDRDHASHARHDHVLAFEPLVLLFFRVDADGYITKDGLRTGGGDNCVVCTGFGVGDTRLRYFVAQVVEFVMLVMIDHLLVRESCLALRIPVDHTQTAVDESFLIEVAEDMNDGFGTGLVHRESCAVPVAGATKFAELFEDDASVLVRPVPRMFEELLAGQVRFVDALLLEAFDNLCLGRNRRMVGTGYPAGVLALQPCTADENILNRLVEHMTHVQHARYIGRRNNDGIRIAVVRLAVKEFVVQPVLVPAGFNVCRIVL